MLEAVKLALRIKSNTFDSELNSLIDTAVAEIRAAGVEISAVDPRQNQAVILYCKANFGDIEHADRFQQAFERLRTAMALDHGEPEVAE